MIPAPFEMSCKFLFFEGQLFVVELLSKIDDILRVLQGEE